MGKIEADRHWRAGETSRPDASTRARGACPESKRGIQDKVSWYCIITKKIIPSSTGCLEGNHSSHPSVGTTDPHLDTLSSPLPSYPPVALPPVQVLPDPSHAEKVQAFPTPDSTVRWGGTGSIPEPKATQPESTPMAARGRAWRRSMRRH